MMTPRILTPTTTSAAHASSSSTPPPTSAAQPPQHQLLEMNGGQHLATSHAAAAASSSRPEGDASHHHLSSTLPSGIPRVVISSNTGSDGVAGPRTTQSSGASHLQQPLYQPAPFMGPSDSNRMMMMRMMMMSSSPNSSAASAPPTLSTHPQGPPPFMEGPPLLGLMRHAPMATTPYQPPTSSSHSSMLHQQSSMLQIHHDPMTTPWTLGSTDGSYASAMAMMILQQQQAPPPPPEHHEAHPEDWNQQAYMGMSSHEAGGVALSNGATATTATPTRSTATGATSTSHRSSAYLMSSDPVGSLNSSTENTGGAPILTPSSPPEEGGVVANTFRSGPSPDRSQEMMAAFTGQRSIYQDRLFRQPSAAVEAVLAASCEVMGFDIAEMWLRTGPKTHQLTNSHLRPTALEDSVRKDLVDVYYGDKSSERTHRLSPALCKRAKEANDVVWITAHTASGAEALRCSISHVRTAVAVPVCHEASNTNITIIFFSIRRVIVRPAAVEFLVHMALAAGVASVNSLSEDGLIDRDVGTPHENQVHLISSLARSEHVPNLNSNNTNSHSGRIRHAQVDQYSVTGAPLDLQWRQLHNVEYLTDGGNSWIHTAVLNGRPVVVKTLKPECQDVVVAINEIEGELAVHSRLNHTNIVALIGAGTTSKGIRFVVLERLDGGTLTQMLGYDTRIRDRRRRFWRRKQFSFLDVLRIARSIAAAMVYCHEEAIPGSMVLHRDLKPDNIGFTLDGTVKILDFGLAKVVENASVDSDEVYTLSGETGSLRYMAPEVADALPYNYGADVYSFGIILWELIAAKKPFEGLNRELFYERIVHGGERPPVNKKWPQELASLMTECWDADMRNRPKFRDVVRRIDSLLEKEKGGVAPSKKPFLPKLSVMIDRHSTWF